MRIEGQHRLQHDYVQFPTSVYKYILIIFDVRGSYERLTKLQGISEIALHLSLQAIDVLILKNL